MCRYRYRRRYAVAPDVRGRAPMNATASRGAHETGYQCIVPPSSDRGHDISNFVVDVVAGSDLPTVCLLLLGGGGKGR
jgi:hypothetical protein